MTFNEYLRVLSDLKARIYKLQEAQKAQGTNIQKAVDDLEYEDRNDCVKFLYEQYRNWVKDRLIQAKEIEKKVQKARIEIDAIIADI